MISVAERAPDMALYVYLLLRLSSAAMLQLHGPFLVVPVIPCCVTQFIKLQIG